jgi:uncharacterized protein YecE (DUF72 family)
MVSDILFILQKNYWLMSVKRNKDIEHLFYSGTSGLSLPVPRAQYPLAFQSKSRLAYYSSLFNSIEINSIFYKLPRSKTITNWSEMVPGNFRFTFKISKTITHVKGLNFSTKDVNDFLNVVENAGDKRGCLLAQFPPSLKVDNINQLQHFLEVVAEAIQHKEWKIAVEFRDKSWYQREVYELLDEFNASLVKHDIAASATPLDTLIGSFIYLRFHGPEPRYRGSYSDAYLKAYSKKIKTWINEKRTVYAYFNNTVGDAAKNLETLNYYVRS